MIGGNPQLLGNIVLIDPANVQSRLEILRYSYVIANAGFARWQELETQVDDFFTNIDAATLVKILQMEIFGFSG